MNELERRAIRSPGFVEGLETGERRAETAFVRLHKLVSKGYQPELGARMTDQLGAIWLRHWGRTPYRVVCLYPHGLLVGGVGEGALRVLPEDHDGFATFLRTVATPTWWESTRPVRLRITAAVCFYGLISVIGLLIWLAGRAAWIAVSGS